MDLLSDWQHHHRLNVILLSAIGLWPYENKLILRLKRIVGSMFAFGCCFSQLFTIFTMDYTIRLLIQNAPIIFVGCSVLLKYCSFLVSSDYIKRVTETINGDWRNLPCKEEIEIIKKYIKRGKFHAKSFAMLTCPAAVPLLLAPLSYSFLDIIMPLNESRNRSFPITFELFFDQKKYFFLAAFLFDGAILVGALVFVSTEGLFIVYIQHACALFEVASHRIRKFLCTTSARDSRRRNDVVVIGQVVEIHCRAISHCKSIREDLLPPYLILVAFGILSLSTYLFNCTQTFATHKFSEFVTSAIFCFGILAYMFYVNFVVQGLLVSSHDIFHVLYDTEWHTFPTSTRKLVLFCMLNSAKPVTMDVCRIYIPSFESFSLVARMAMSYTTALYSFQ